MHSRHSDYLIPVSNANKTIFKDQDNIKVIYDKLPEKEQYEEYFPKNHKVIKVLYLANYNIGKGQNYAIEVLEEFSLRNPNVRLELQFIGGDLELKKNYEYKAFLMDIVNRKSLNEMVTFMDKTDDVEKTMKAFDIILNFLSLSHSLG